MKRITLLLLVLFYFFFFQSSVKAQIAAGESCDYTKLDSGCAPGLFCERNDLGSGFSGICKDPSDRSAFPNCGGYGQYCCYDSELGDFPSAAWCFEGKKTVSGGGLSVCECFSAGRLSDLGGACKNDSECLRGSCASDGVCRVTEGCLDLSHTEFPTDTSAREFCAKAGGSFCTQDVETSSYDSRWCCESSYACEVKQSTAGIPFDYCNQVPGDINDPSTQRGACQACVNKGIEGEYIFTAVGCIQVAQDGKFNVFAASLIKILLGVAGMASFLSILAASFIFTTSRGESGKVKQAKELITAAISGLLFIIFSIIILEYIGVTILNLPGLG